MIACCCFAIPMPSHFTEPCQGDVIATELSGQQGGSSGAKECLDIPCGYSGPATKVDPYSLVGVTARKTWTWWTWPSLGSGLDVVRGLACSSDPGERYRRELAPGRVTLGGPVSRVGSRQTKTPARRYAVRWQPHQPTILRRANNPPRRNPFVTKLIRESSRTAQHGNGPQPAPDQRVRNNRQP